MKVLVVGSNRVSDDPAEMAETQKHLAAAGMAIGAELARRGHSIAIGSDHEDDVDPHVVRGALGENPNCQIEVHVPMGNFEPYGDEPGVTVKVVPHQFPDWDVTVMDTLGKMDGLIALGGRAGVIQAGLAAWKMGTPVIPVASFGGGGDTLWHYGSGTRQAFYRGALEDAEIDQLAGAWRKDSAGHVVEALEAVAKRAAFATTSRGVLWTAILLTVLATVGWIASLLVPLARAEEQASNPHFVPGFFVGICLAGLLGGTMQTLRRLRDGRRLEIFRSLIDVVLGTAAGLVTAMLFLIAQLAVRGEVTFDWNESDYARLALLGGMASLFASLYLDSALARFDTLKDSAIKASYGE